jgi:hypothetical protein
MSLDVLSEMICGEHKVYLLFFMLLMDHGHSLKRAELHDLLV